MWKNKGDILKKLWIILIVLIGLTGCTKNSPKSEVENYMKKYKSLDSEVLVGMEDTIDTENLSDSHEEVYRDILKKQYKDLKYKIIDEKEVDDKTYVTVKVTVYNLYKSSQDASLYLENNKEEFNNENGEYDLDKFLDYKLNKMKMTTEKIDHEITFTVTKENDKYVLEQPSDIDLKKIHGIYNSDSE